MPEEQSGTHPTLALSTKVEEDFVAPLTAIRGALEILRDFPDLGASERENFVATALLECGRLERGVADLASTVYAAGRRAQADDRPDLSQAGRSEYGERIQLSGETGIAEIDFGGVEFSSSDIVNAFYDVIESLVADSGRKWFFLINHRDISIWPEAWVAFAQREKRLREHASLGTARFAEQEGAEASADPNLFSSRAAALAMIENVKSAKS